MGPEALAQVLRPLAGMFDPARFPNLLRGLDTPDDAAVWRLDGEHALVQTVDFFPPVVDDPYHFGAIAAANALSDLYAMGAEPLFALNLVTFPDDLSPDVLSEILRGGAEKVHEAGAVIPGGHTTSGPEPMYGLVATGLVHPERVLAKGGARADDVLLLTKPIGTGLLATAHKRDAIEPDELDAAIRSMEHLNRDASQVLRSFGRAVHALTDVTGFGLAGHAHEVAHQSGLALQLDWEAVPRLPGAERCARAGMAFGGQRRNREYYGPFVEEARPLEPWERDILYDPQTSGGLLAAIDPDSVRDVLAAMERLGVRAWSVGRVLEGRAGAVRLG